jgi:hypothetical protein
MPAATTPSNGNLFAIIEDIAFLPIPALSDRVLSDEQLAEVGGGRDQKLPSDNGFPPSPRVQFGNQLRDVRERAGLKPAALAAFLQEKVAYLKALEAGKREPPREPAFYQRLRAVSGITDADIAHLLQVAGYDPDWLAQINQHLATKRTPPPGGTPAEAAPEHSAKSLPDISDSGIIPSRMPPKPEVENGDHLPSRTPEQGDPSAAPGTNVPEHGLEQPSSQPEQRRRAPKKGAVYEVVPTLRQAAEKTGVPLDELMTTRDIRAEWDVSPLRVLRWTWSGPHGEPHLSPLPVRLKGSGKGGGQLLFRRSDVERIVSEPPKGGRPPK